MFDLTKRAREQKRASKIRYTWDASVIGQTVLVEVSSDVDDERNILTTSGDGEKEIFYDKFIDLFYKAFGKEEMERTSRVFTKEVQAHNYCQIGNIGLALDVMEH